MFTLKIILSGLIALVPHEDGDAVMFLLAQDHNSKPEHHSLLSHCTNGTKCDQHQPIVLDGMYIRLAVWDANGNSVGDRPVGNLGNLASVVSLEDAANDSAYGRVKRTLLERDLPANDSHLVAARVRLTGGELKAGCEEGEFKFKKWWFNKMHLAQELAESVSFTYQGDGRAELQIFASGIADPLVLPVKANDTLAVTIVNEPTDEDYEKYLQHKARSPHFAMFYGLSNTEPDGRMPVPWRTTAPAPTCVGAVKEPRGSGPIRCAGGQFAAEPGTW